MKNKNVSVPLSDRVIEIILGTVLGDGSLKKQKGYSNARLQFRHTERDAEYFFWKTKALQEVTGLKPVNRQKADGYSSFGKLRFLSRALPELSALHELTHKHNTLLIKRKWLNQMTPLSLAIWWCDDGSLIGEGGRRGVFCTDGFDKKSVQMLSQYLKKVWNVRTVVAPVRNKRDGKQEQYWRLWIRSQEELKKFLRIILPYIPVRSMLRKVLLLYKDSQFQQRWISEVVSLSKFSQKIVTEEYENKKMKWNKFR
jgi:hypothetical protein